MGSVEVGGVVGGGGVDDEADDEDEDEDVDVVGDDEVVDVDVDDVVVTLVFLRLGVLKEAAPPPISRSFWSSGLIWRGSLGDFFR